MNKLIKKIVCLTLCVVMGAFCLTSCGDSKSDNSASKESNKTYKIGICQLVQHEALDAATKGFKDALTKKLGDKVTFDEQNASGETTNCTTICSKFVSDNDDLIMANATPALTAASQATENIPIIATSITDYATALDIKDWKGTTGFNVTGTSDLPPLDKQADMVKEIFPNAKTVGILYCSSEANSKYQADTITPSLEKLGFTVKNYTFVDTKDVTDVATQAAKDCDVIYAPTDNTVASNGEAINNVLEPAKVPLIAGEEGICKSCGVATLSISYYDIGYKAGEMAYDILANGKNAGTMKVQYAKDLTKKYFADRAKKLGLTIPSDYEAISAE